MTRIPIRHSRGRPQTRDESGRVVNRNFLALGSGEALARLIAFGVTVYLARLLGADGYGVVAFALAVNLYLIQVGDWGVHTLGTKEVAARRESIADLAPEVMGARIVLALLLGGFVGAIVLLTMAEPERTVLAIYLMTLVPLAANTKWIHLGIEEARPVGLSRVITELLVLAGVLLLVRDLGDLAAVPIAQVIGEVAAALFLWIALVRAGHPLRVRWALGKALPVFRRATPLVGHILLGLLIYNSDLIFLRVFDGPASVGFYAAAYALISFLLNMGSAYGMTLLPTLTRLGAGTPEERGLYHDALAQVWAVCLPIAVGGYLLAGDVIGLVFGGEYGASATALAILVWTVPISVCRTVAWSALMARERQDLVLRMTAWATALNLVLNVALIPPLGIMGAAIATVATECLRSFLGFRYTSSVELKLVPLNRLWRATVASVLMAGVLIALEWTTLWPGLPIGVVAYGAVLYSVGGIRVQRGELPALAV